MTTPAPATTKGNYIFKIISGGMGGVGKTTFLLRYMNQRFIEDQQMTTHVMKRDGSERVQVIVNPRADTPFWLPDGRKSVDQFIESGAN